MIFYCQNHGFIVLLSHFLPDRETDSLINLTFTLLSSQVTVPSSWHTLSYIHNNLLDNVDIAFNDSDAGSENPAICLKLLSGVTFSLILMSTNKWVLAIYGFNEISSNCSVQQRYLPTYLRHDTF